MKPLDIFTEMLQHFRAALAATKLKIFYVMSGEICSRELDILNETSGQFLSMSVAKPGELKHDLFLNLTLSGLCA